MSHHAPHSAMLSLPTELPLAGGGDAADVQSRAPVANLPITPLPFDPGVITALKSLRCGCWLVNYRIHGAPALTAYDGTMRVECHRAGRTASGDVYQRPRVRVRVPLPPDQWIEIERPGKPPLIIKHRYESVLASPPNPAAGIPILARSAYRWYLRVTQLLERLTLSGGFTLGFEMMRFTSPNTWTSDGHFTAKMAWTPSPAGYPSASDYLEGDVFNAAGANVGRLKMGWISPYLRRAVVEIDRVSASEAPLNNGAGIEYRAVYDAVGWDVTVVQSDSNVAEPSGESWSDAEAHATMLARRAATNFDSEWRYHILAVRRLDSTERGIMYDAFATDSNNVPREGVAISSHWTIPNTATWGLVRGLRFGTAVSPYFRTAIHELGHAMGLFHNTVDNGFMNTTNVIADNATAATPFPNNVQWSFATDDAKRLRHYPDPFVRPGAVPFGDASSTTPPITPADLSDDAGELQLTITAVRDDVPIGAPVRVELALQNNDDLPRRVPAVLGFKGGCVSGQVTGPDGVLRSFRALMHCVEDEPVQLLAPQAKVQDSLTLLRGPEGALFPSPGAYRIDVTLHWHEGGVELHCQGHTQVMVTGAVTASHAKAALKVLSTPDALLSLALAGDHLDEGNAAIDAALADKTLRPHFAYVRARRAAARFMKRKPEHALVRSLLDADTVMSQAETKKAAKALAAAKVAGNGNASKKKGR